MMYASELAMDRHNPRADDLCAVRIVDLLKLHPTPWRIDPSFPHNGWQDDRSVIVDRDGNTVLGVTAGAGELQDRGAHFLSNTDIRALQLMVSSVNACASMLTLCDSCGALCAHGSLCADCGGDPEAGISQRQ